MRIIIILFCFITLGLVSQTCGTDEYNRGLINENLEHYNDIENKLQQTLLKKSFKNQSVTIPVVFHILYKTQTENLHDSIIVRQLEVLNRCFNLQNSDTSLLTDTLRDYKGNFNINFELAKYDPNGIPTSGITRTHTKELAYSYYNPRIKYDSTNGKSPWDTRKYLNVWVGELRYGLLGYSQFPGGSPSTDGIVISFRVVGNMLYNWNDEYTDFNQGKVLVHEVGHWLNLYHTWGTEECGDDLVDDTGRQRGPTFPSTNCPDTLMSYCDSTIDRVFVKNYMDYCGDECMVAFTTGQVQRGLSSLWSYREEMINHFENQERIIDNIFFIYPSITSGRISIAFYNVNIQSDYYLYITGVQGNIVKSLKINNSSPLDLNLNFLSSGVYNITITDNKQVLQTEKIVVNHQSPYGGEVLNSHQ